MPMLDPLLRTPHKHPSLVLKASGVNGDFDSHAVDCPFLFVQEGLGGGRFQMMFVGFDGRGYQTGLASSDDLLHWKGRGVIFGRRDDVAVLRHNAALTSILRENDLLSPGRLRKIDGRYWATYHAYPEPGYEAGAAVIGIASSADLLHWEPQPPCLRADDPDAAPWERSGLYKSFLLEHDGVYYLFYNAKDRSDWPWREQTGVATSRDLVRWQRHPANPLIANGPAGSFDDRFASDPCVLRIGPAGPWTMFYFGLSTDGHARESAAVSDDLLTWQKTGEILVDVGPPGSIDEQYAHKPGVIYHAGRLYHYYCAVSKGTGSAERRGIAVATSA